MILAPGRAVSPGESLPAEAGSTPLAAMAVIWVPSHGASGAALGQADSGGPGCAGQSRESPRASGAGLEFALRLCRAKARRSGAACGLAIVWLCSGKRNGEGPRFDAVL